jgi:hypothetical protein
LVLATVLQRDIGVRYNPALIEREDFFADSRNLFIHGVLETGQGTTGLARPTAGCGPVFSLHRLERGDHLPQRLLPLGGNMFRTTCCAPVLVTVSLAVLPPLCHARVHQSWSYERLLREAQLVLIAQPLVSQDSGHTDSDNVWKVKLVGVKTTLKVRAVLKGQSPGETITLVHYRLPKGVKVQHGPSLISFRLGPTVLETSTGARFGWGVTEYMLFLKKAKDGHFEPVSGQLDAEDAVRAVVPPLPPTGESFAVSEQPSGKGRELRGRKARNDIGNSR